MKRGASRAKPDNKLIPFMRSAKKVKAELVVEFLKVRQEKYNKGQNGKYQPSDVKLAENIRLLNRRSAV